MKSTIIVDGSFMMHRSIQGLNGRIDFIPSVYDMSFTMLKDFKSMIRDLVQCGFGEEIIYALDSPSWRKQSSSIYKGNREKKMDFAPIFEAHNRMLDEIKPSGINIIRVNNCEADDIIYKWSTTCAIDGNFVLIISEDKDLTQMVKFYDSIGTCILQYRPISKNLVVPIGFSDFLKNLNKPADLNDLLNDLLNGKDEEKHILINLIEWCKSKSLNIQEVNANEISFVKIMTGDKGDNVMSIKEEVKNGKLYKFTENQAKKVLELYKYQLNLDEVLNEENLNHLNDCINRVLKFENKFDFKERLIENYSLVVLHNQAYPLEVLESLNHSLNRSLVKLNLIDFLKTTISNKETDLKIIEDVKIVSGINITETINQPEHVLDSFWDDLIV